MVRNKIIFLLVIFAALAFIYEEMNVKHSIECFKSDESYIISDISKGPITHDGNSISYKSDLSNSQMKIIYNDQSNCKISKIN